MDLFQFNLQKPELRARWYARAVQILSGKDEALRTLWLKTIWGSAEIQHGPDVAGRGQPWDG